MEKENIFVVGFPRSGNVWVSNLLGSALNSAKKARYDRMSLADGDYKRTGGYVIRQEHVGAERGDRYRIPEGSKVVLVIRDPRDVITSAYHYWGIDSIEETCKSVLFGESPTSQCGGWLEMYQGWSARDYTHLVRYEDLHLDAVTELEYMLFALGVESPYSLEQVVEEQSFSSRLEKINDCGHEMPYGATVQRKALRKGIVGDWTNYFTVEDEAYVARHAGVLAETFGYDIT